MNVRERIKRLRNSIIDRILNHIEKTKKLPSTQYEEYNSGGHIDISKLSLEERKNAFMEFAEGNKGLYDLLNTAYEQGIESMFCCAGHSENDNGYVVFKVTDDNLKKLQQLGKVLSHEGVATSFENHHELGKRVLYHGFKVQSKNWFEKANEILENLPQHKIIPSIYYHEMMIDSNKPFSYRIRESIIKALERIRYNSSEAESSKKEEITDLSAEEEQKQNPISEQNDTSDVQKASSVLESVVEATEESTRIETINGQAQTIKSVEKAKIQEIETQKDMSEKG